MEKNVQNVFAGIQKYLRQTLGNKFDELKVDVIEELKAIKVLSLELCEIEEAEETFSKFVDDTETSGKAEPDQSQTKAMPFPPCNIRFSSPEYPYTALTVFFDDPNKMTCEYIITARDVVSAEDISVESDINYGVLKNLQPGRGYVIFAQCISNDMKSKPTFFSDTINVFGGNDEADANMKYETYLAKLLRGAQSAPSTTDSGMSDLQSEPSHTGTGRGPEDDEASVLTEDAETNSKQAEGLPTLWKSQVHDTLKIIFPDMLLRKMLDLLKKFEEIAIQKVDDLKYLKNPKVNKELGKTLKIVELIKLLEYVKEEKYKKPPGEISIDGRSECIKESTVGSGNNVQQSISHDDRIPQSMGHTIHTQTDQVDFSTPLESAGTKMKEYHTKFVRETKPIKSGKRVYKGRIERKESKYTPSKTREVAIKLVPKSDTDKDSAKQVREPSNLMDLHHHPNVVTYVHCDECGEEDHNSFYIAMEMCHVDSLHDRIRNLNKYTNLNNDEYCKSIIQQIAQGLHHIHQNQIIHRDIKPPNILFSRDGDVVKVADFGFSKRIQLGSNATSQSSNTKGTDGWRSPEIYQGGNDRRATAKTDVFSFGLVTYSVVSRGDHAFGHEDEWYPNIKNYRGLWVGNIKVADPSIAEDLIKKMLRKEPEKRPSTSDILAHPYFWKLERKIGFYERVLDKLDSLITYGGNKMKEYAQNAGSGEGGRPPRSAHFFNQANPNTAISRLKEHIERICISEPLNENFLEICAKLFTAHNHRTHACNSNASRNLIEERTQHNEEMPAKEWIGRIIGEFTDQFKPMEGETGASPENTKTDNSHDDVKQTKRKEGETVTLPKNTKADNNTTEEQEEDPEKTKTAALPKNNEAYTHTRADTNRTKNLLNKLNNFSLFRKYQGWKHWSQWLKKCGEIYVELIGVTADNFNSGELNKPNGDDDDIVAWLKECASRLASSEKLSAEMQKRCEEELEKLETEARAIHRKEMLGEKKSWRFCLEHEGNRRSELRRYDHKTFVKNAQGCNGDTIFVLLRYVRHSLVHFEKMKMKHKKEGWTCKENLWEFVSSAVPELFPHVYNTMKGEFEDYIQQSRQPNYCLPESECNQNPS